MGLRMRLAKSMLFDVMPRLHGAAEGAVEGTSGPRVSMLRAMCTSHLPSATRIFGTKMLSLENSLSASFTSSEDVSPRAAGHGRVPVGMWSGRSLKFTSKLRGTRGADGLAVAGDADRVSCTSSLGNLLDASPIARFDSSTGFCKAVYGSCGLNAETPGSMVDACGQS